MEEFIRTAGITGMAADELRALAEDLDLIAEPDTDAVMRDN